MTLKIKSALCLCCALMVTSAFGNDITVDALARGGAFARDRQLRDFEQVFKPGTSGFFGFDMMYLPLPTQTRLSSEYGSHDGYAFRHRLEGYFSAPVARTGVDFGILWFAERHGWDNEDFVAFPYYGKFSVVRRAAFSTRMWSASRISIRTKAILCTGGARRLRVSLPRRRCSMARIRG